VPRSANSVAVMLLYSCLGKALEARPRTWSCMGNMGFVLAGSDDTTRPSDAMTRFWKSTRETPRRTAAKRAVSRT